MKIITNKDPDWAPCLCAECGNDPAGAVIKIGGVLLCTGCGLAGYAMLHHFPPNWDARKPDGWDEHFHSLSGQPLTPAEFPFCDVQSNFEKQVLLAQQFRDACFTYLKDKNLETPHT